MALSLCVWWLSPDFTEEDTTKEKRFFYQSTEEVTKYYAGIGSRKTPPDILDLMTSIASALQQQGWVLRSGGARGADRAFEYTVAQSKIYTPITCSKWFNWDDAIRMAKQYHPNPDLLSNPALALMARNSYQILGDDLNTPSRFVLCWTPDGAYKSTSRTTGGTGQAIRIAIDQGIRVWNLGDADHRDAWEACY